MLIIVVKLIGEEKARMVEELAVKLYTKVSLHKGEGLIIGC